MRWIKQMLDIPGVRRVTSVEHIKGMSFSKRQYNLSGIIPIGDGFILPWMANINVGAVFTRENYRKELYLVLYKTKRCISAPKAKGIA